MKDMTFFGEWHELKWDDISLVRGTGGSILWYGLLFSIIIYITFFVKPNKKWEWD